MSGSGTPTDEREALARDFNKAGIRDSPGTAQSAHDPFAAGFGGAGGEASDGGGSGSVGIGGDGGGGGGGSSSSSSKSKRKEFPTDPLARREEFARQCAEVLKKKMAYELIPNSGLIFSPSTPTLPTHPATLFP